MEFENFAVGADDAGRRLDRVLRKFLSEEHISSLYKSLRKRIIKVDGKKCDGNFRLSKENVIQIADFLLKKTFPNQKNAENNAEAIEFLKKITVFRNGKILILNKPYDISVQPSSSQKISLCEIVQSEYEISHKNLSLSFKTGPLHRLDRKTTGLIAFSQNLEGAKWFSEAIKNHLIQKTYFAILEGTLSENQIWEDYIGVRSEELGIRSEKLGVRSEKARGFHTVRVNSDGGKFAHTEVFPISHAVFEGREITLAKVLIKTGRTHQIRSQSAFHGFPLLGDVAYGAQKIDSKRGGQEIFLHAVELSFPKDNPLGLPEKICAPLPKDFEKLFPEISF